MNRADKAVLRLTLGLGLAVLVAYGFAMPMPFVVCLMSILVLSKPGPPLPLTKAVVIAAVFATVVSFGVLMVPLLEHYAWSGILLTGTILYGVFYWSAVRANPLTAVLVISFAVIPVAGVADQAIVGALSMTLAIGILIGALVSSASHALFPDPPTHATGRPVSPSASREAARWISLRATVIVVPVFVLALTDPSFYVAAIMKTVALSQQAGEVDARSAGSELVGSTLMGAFIATIVWLGLSLHPSLWMLTLWMMSAALWSGSGIFRTRSTRLRPSFWSNALITMLILLGPAIEDSASGKSVFEASAVRTGLFVGVALYAWGTVWLLERWLNSRRLASGSGHV